VEKYCNSLVAEGEFVSPLIKNVQNIFEFVISVVNDCQKEIG
jgi:hypothetical protein